MLTLYITFVFLIQESTGAWSNDSWRRQDADLDFSHLVLWKVFPAASRIGCLLGCHSVFSRGCGYRRIEKLCHVYLDWGQTSNWTRVEGMDYYTSVFQEGWSDLRRHGVSSALLIGTQRMTWLNAKYYCEDFGGHLYIMDTEEKRQALIDHFEQQGMTLCCNYWLGLSDIETENQWLWVNGGAVTKYWSKDEPDDLGNQDCGVLRSNSNFEMNDRNCQHAYRFMCELPLG